MIYELKVSGESAGHYRSESQAQAAAKMLGCEDFEIVPVSIPPAPRLLQRWRAYCIVSFTYIATAASYPALSAQVAGLPYDIGIEDNATGRSWIV